MWVGGQRHAPAVLPPGKTRYRYWRLGETQGRSGRVRKISHPNGTRSPDRQKRGKSLYRLSHRCSLDNSRINLEYRWNDVDRGRGGRNVKYWEEKLCKGHYGLHKSHMNRNVTTRVSDVGLRLSTLWYESPSSSASVSMEGQFVPHSELAATAPCSVSVVM